MQFIIAKERLDGKYGLRIKIESDTYFSVALATVKNMYQTQFLSLIHIFQ